MPGQLEVLELRWQSSLDPEPAEREDMDDRGVARGVLDGAEEPVGLLLRQVVGEPLGASRRLEPLGGREPERPEQARQPRTVV